MSPPLNSKIESLAEAVDFLVDLLRVERFRRIGH